MKLLLTIGFAFFTICCNSQGRKRTREEIYNDPAQLSTLLTSGYNSEKEKVSAIFHWITGNISYFRPQQFKKKNKSEIYDLDDYPGPLPTLTERVARQVLKERTAVCEGYARLFQSLCAHTGIRAEIVTGYAKNRGIGNGSRFKSNHSWNAVMIDSKWYLVDATWASGFIAGPSGEFVRHYDPYYFMASPEDFIQHHYPDDLRWALMENPPVIAEYRAAPFHQRSFNKYQITSFFPSRGIIEAAVGDTIRLQLETSLANRNYSIASDSLWEEMALLKAPVYAFIKPSAMGPGARVQYNFTVESADVQWLYVMYNDDAVLRYRLNIKREKTADRNDY